MYCTGGIRCEKASAYLLQLGFEEVYHLRGGIFALSGRGGASASLWRGECFVFDERVSLDHGLQKGEVVICDDCKAMVKQAGEKWSALRGQAISSDPLRHISSAQRAALSKPPD